MIWVPPAALTAAAVLLLADLAGCNLFGPPEVYETADITVFVAADFDDRLPD